MSRRKLSFDWLKTHMTEQGFVSRIFDKINLILHCGANDVGSTLLKSFIQSIKTSLGKIQLLLPNTKIIWSQLPPGAGRRPSGLSVHTLRRWANLAHPSFATFSHYTNIVVKGRLLSPLFLKCALNEHRGRIRGT